ncbi:MAG: GDP-L-fucose synthase family protein [Gammaproteobacteria bacterium]
MVNYYMDKTASIFVAGHQGLVGSSIYSALKAQGYNNVIVSHRAVCDLTDGAAVDTFFNNHKIDYVFLAAAHVGGIGANSTYPGDFIINNLLIQSHVLHAAMKARVKRLLFLGSSCIYPADCQQPMEETALMTGPLEVTNRPYAVAKIAGIETCWAYNKQHHTKYLAAMPTNLYGLNDNYHLENSHVMQALMHKMHLGKVNNKPTVSLWGTGTIKREFLYAADLADACIFLMNLPDNIFESLLHKEGSQYPIINIGYGSDISIKALAHLIKKTVGYEGALLWEFDKPEGVKKKLLNSSKIQTLGWQPRFSLEKGVQLMYADFLKRYNEGTLRA